MKALLEFLSSNPDTTQQGIFFMLFIVVLYLLRSDSKGHKEEYKQTVHKMFNVVDKNTESHTRLSESINNLKDRIK